MRPIVGIVETRRRRMAAKVGPSGWGYPLEVDLAVKIF